MQLKKIYEIEKKKEFLFLARKIVSILNDDLNQIQNFYKDSYYLEPYPSFRKCKECIDLINPVLETPINSEKIAQDLVIVSEIFDKNSNNIFRDFTTKNVVINDPSLVGKNSDFIKQKIKSNLFTSEYLNKKIKHLDFSGLKYRAPIEDDFITLNYHESVYWTHKDSEKIYGASEKYSMRPKNSRF